MNIENQVVSLELAEELKLAWYPQKGAWESVPKIDPKDESVTWSLQRKGGPAFSMPCTAPTVAELGEELPAGIYNSHFDAEFAIYKNGDKTGYRWFVVYTDCITGENRFFEEDDILANAMCKMWLYLKKKRIIINS